MAIEKGNRERANPEPSGPPGTRSTQRGTDRQLSRGEVSEDEALAWEREEQEHLPARGSSVSDSEIAEDRQPPEETPTRGGPIDENLQTGGSRGPSNDNRG